ELGLDPRDYDALALSNALERARHPSPPWFQPRALARLDVRATYAYLRIAPHVRDGRVPRSALDPDWARPPRADWAAQLRRELAHDRAATLASLEPRHDGYVRLRQLLVRYRAIAAQGGWREIPAGEPLSLGARGPRVAALIRRLAITGELGGPVADTVFD